MKYFPKLTSNESLIGLIYYLLQLLVIPSLAVGVNFLLGNTMSESVLNVICFAINFVAVLIIFRKFLLANWQPVRTSPWNVLRCAGAGFLMYFAGNALFSLLSTAIDPEFANLNDAAISMMAESNFGLMTIGTVILVPIAEECFYRGLIFRGIYDRSPFLAYFLSMVIFSLAHVLGYVALADFGTLMLCFLQYLPAGFALAWSYRASGSIYASVLIHMTVNQMGMLLMR